MTTGSLRLGVNIDHVATLRMARGTIYPNILDAAAACESAGAHGITVHLREDRRHIQDQDIFDLRKQLNVRMNLEMANSREILDIALQVVPHEVCLVPEKREELTTEGGLDVAGQIDDLASTVRELTDAGIVVSMFIDPEEAQIRATAEIGAPYIELHTGTFCDSVDTAADDELQRLVGAAVLAHELGIIVNAGHGLNISNVSSVLAMPNLDTLNIGHSIISRAVFIGLEAAVEEMLQLMLPYGGGQHD